MDNLEKIAFATITQNMQLEAKSRGLNPSEMLFLSKDMLECIAEAKKKLSLKTIDEIMEKNRQLFDKFTFDYINTL